MPICSACKQPVETWWAWWGDCPKNPAGHALTTEEWMSLPGWKQNEEKKETK